MSLGTLPKPGTDRCDQAITFSSQVGRARAARPRSTVVGAHRIERPFGRRERLRHHRRILEPESLVCGDTGRDSVLVHDHQPAVPMGRLTITLSDERYRALKEAAAQRGKTIGQLIDESLELYGIRSRDEAREIVRRARTHADLSEDEAMSVALDEVRRVRTGK